MFMNFEREREMEKGPQRWNRQRLFSGQKLFSRLHLIFNPPKKNNGNIIFPSAVVK